MDSSLIRATLPTDRETSDRETSDRETSLFSFDFSPSANTEFQ